MCECFQILPGHEGPINNLDANDSGQMVVSSSGNLIYFHALSSALALTEEERTELNGKPPSPLKWDLVFKTHM